MGIKNHNGTFKQGFIYKMLHNKKYTEIVETNGQAFDNIVPILIDDDLFERAKHTMLSNSHRGAKYRAKAEYLLIGKLYCGYCNDRLTAKASNSKDGRSRRYYKCATIKRYKGKCKCKTIRKEKLDELVPLK